MNDKSTITLFFIEIYLSLFFEKGRIYRSMRETDGEGRQQKDLDTAILTLILFLDGLFHTHSFI